MRKKPSSRTEAEAEPESKAEISPGQQSVRAEYSPEKKKRTKIKLHVKEKMAEILKKQTSFSRNTCIYYCVDFWM